MGAEAGVALVLANVNEQPLSLMRRSGFAAVLGEDAIVPTVAAAFEAGSPTDPLSPVPDRPSTHSP